MVEAALVLSPIEMQISSLPSRVKFFAMFDCLNGLDLLRVQPDFLKFFGLVVTHFGNFTMKGNSLEYTSTPIIIKTDSYDTYWDG